ncbi:efflux pump ustT [Colletotrichum spaethianum]|uniref:Efflux pump ustT n=1 Tax=Colletotrichum spaethianum TaxID=700344 RepID=A0AA37L5R5_9PEZI|nr:efflux pump ustT [Colletotrichum spaethianum]GKT42536.1 efflux pump ustT [Colletotrichum spaethianum]
MAPTSSVDHDGDVEARRPEEETPLLAHDLPQTIAPTRAYQIKVIGLAMTFIILIEIGVYLQVPPSYQLMEEIICRKHYPDHIISQDDDDDLCKAALVQGELAMVKGWQASFDCIARKSSLLTAIPYGVIADKYGRRPVLSLAMLGITLEFLWMVQPLGMILLIVGTCLPPFLPETLDLRRAADEEVEQTLHRAEHGAKVNRTLKEQIVFAVKNDMGHVYNFLIKSRRVIGLVAGFNLTVVVKYVKADIMAQYVHNLFGWSWAKATLIGTVSTITNIVMLLVILPTLGWYITKRTGVHPLVRDIWLVRLTGILLSLGCFMVAIAFVPWFLIAALIIFSLGTAYTNICRAVLNAVVEPHTIGTLNTTISWVEQMSLLISAPIISGLLKAGNAAGGMWIGLPYMAATVMAVGGTIIVFLYRLPGEKLT